MKKLRRSQIILLAILGGGCLAVWIYLVAVIAGELSTPEAVPTELAAAPSEAIPEATLPPTEIPIKNSIQTPNKEREVKTKEV